jgi:selT/selW/selH-like putative selenoprotein
LAARIKAAKGTSSPDVQVELVKGARGSFEIFRDGTLVFSKLATGQFPASEEDVVKLL